MPIPKSAQTLCHPAGFRLYSRPVVAIILSGSYRGQTRGLCGATQLLLGSLVSKRDRKKLAARIGVFLRQYGRKTRPNWDPNDRDYDREIEKLVKQMDPAEFDRLMNGE